MIRILVFVIITTTYGICSAGPYSKYNSFKRYDPYFSKYTKRYFGPAFDWTRFKAQAIAESNLNPDA